jgi:hypothetical protein
MGETTKPKDQFSARELLIENFLDQIKVVSGLAIGVDERIAIRNFLTGDMSIEQLRTLGPFNDVQLRYIVQVVNTLFDALSPALQTIKYRSALLSRALQAKHSIGGGTSE